MSIIVKGVNLPSSCAECFILCGDSTCDDEDFFFKPEEKICENCPLGELPEHHGRLIDADKMKQWFFRPYSNEESYSNIDIARIIDSQATIVEAE